MISEAFCEEVGCRTSHGRHNTVTVGSGSTGEFGEAVGVRPGIPEVRSTDEGNANSYPFHAQQTSGFVMLHHTLYRGLSET